MFHWICEYVRANLALKFLTQHFWQFWNSLAPITGLSAVKIFNFFVVELFSAYFKMTPYGTTQWQKPSFQCLVPSWEIFLQFLSTSVTCQIQCICGTKTNYNNILYCPLKRQIYRHVTFAIFTYIKSMDIRQFYHF